MKQYGLLAAAFGGTLAVLLVAFLLVEQLAPGGASATDPSPSPVTTAAAVASPNPRPTARPLASVNVTPSMSAVASATPTPTTAPATATPRPAATPARSIAPGKTVEIVVPGSLYVQATVSPNAKVTRLPNNTVLITSDRTLSTGTTVVYRLPSSSLPPGTRIVHLEVAVCGFAKGDFWETYGPPGSSPAEHEATPPDADGCWHYVAPAGAGTTVTAIVERQTTFRIDKVVYRITTAK